MTTFTRNWNGAYEGTPPDSQDINQGATRIRELKVDISERMEIDHIYGDGVAAPNSEDGYHNKSTYKKQGSDPSVPTDYGVAYVKDHNNGTNTKPEFHFKNVDGNITRLTERGSIALLKSRNSWEKAQQTPEVDLGTGSGSIAIDASLSNAFIRTINNTSSLVAANITNGVAGQCITLRVIQSGGPHTLDLTGNGLIGSPDVDVASAFPGQTIITLYRAGTSWVVMNISRNIASAI